jgi:hypothetical protein
VGDLEPGGAGAWHLVVPTRRPQARCPLPEPVVVDLRRHLSHRGLADHLAHPSNRSTALLGAIAQSDPRARRLCVGRRVEPEAGIAPSTLYQPLKNFFRRCSEALRAAGDASAADELARATSHWLRR